MNIEHWTRGDKLMCTTSIEAYDIAKQLCAEHQGRLKAEHEANVRSTVTEQKKKVLPEDGPSRTVTEIDYQKHEEFVKTVERQEEEDEFNRKKEEVHFGALWTMSMVPIADIPCMDVPTIIKRNGPFTRKAHRRRSMLPIGFGRRGMRLTGRRILALQQFFTGKLYCNLTMPRRGLKKSRT